MAAVHSNSVLGAFDKTVAADEASQGMKSVCVEDGALLAQRSTPSSNVVGRFASSEETSLNQSRPRAQHEKGPPSPVEGCAVTQILVRSREGQDNLNSRPRCRTVALIEGDNRSFARRRWSVNPDCSIAVRPSPTWPRQGRDPRAVELAEKERPFSNVPL